jgi:NAD(P)-dependent dehydrogenase (short-subunit alcohol dehydrogenase family)
VRSALQIGQANLKNKNTVVTGGSRGLGKEIASHFLREGAFVAICSRNECELESAVKDLRSSVAEPERVCGLCVKHLLTVTINHCGHGTVPTCVSLYFSVHCVRFTGRFPA